MSRVTIPVQTNAQNSVAFEGVRKQLTIRSLGILQRNKNTKFTENLVRKSIFRQFDSRLGCCCNIYAKMCERPVTERYLGNPTSVTCCRHSVLVIEPSSHSDSLCKNLLQFGRRSSRDERSNERECVVVEVSLKRSKINSKKY